MMIKKNYEAEALLHENELVSRFLRIRKEVPKVWTFLKTWEVGHALLAILIGSLLGLFLPLPF